MVSKMVTLLNVIVSASHLIVERLRLKVRVHVVGNNGGEENNNARWVRYGSPHSQTSSACDNCHPNPSDDRRAAPRVNHQKIFIYDTFLGCLQNISRTGVQIKTKLRLSTGEALKMAFSLADGMFVFHGIIVYVRSLPDGNFLAGVEFASLSDRDSLLLRRFLDSQFPKSHGQKSSLFSRFLESIKGRDMALLAKNKSNI